MEWNGFRMRLEKAMSNSEKVKVLFKYPNMDKLIIKSGIIKEVGSSCFTIDEVKDGIMVFSYTFLIEVKGVENDAKI